MQETYFKQNSSERNTKGHYLTQWGNGRGISTKIKNKARVFVITTTI